MTTVDASLPRYARVRKEKRASYDRDTIYPLLDQALMAHVGFIADERPMVIPMIFARKDETLYLHGVAKGRFHQAGSNGVPMCLEVTHLDGIVVARSGFNSSINYRSVIVHGSAHWVEDEAEAEAALWLITDHLIPGRSAELRQNTAKELKATGVVALEIEQASVKTRRGPPVDDEADLESDRWAGVVAVETRIGAVLPHSDVAIAEPASLQRMRSKFGSV